MVPFVSLFLGTRVYLLVAEVNSVWTSNNEGVAGVCVISSSGIVNGHHVVDSVTASLILLL